MAGCHHPVNVMQSSHSAILTGRHRQRILSTNTCLQGPVNLQATSESRGKVSGTVADASDVTHFFMYIIAQSNRTEGSQVYNSSFDAVDRTSDWGAGIP